MRFLRRGFGCGQGARARHRHREKSEKNCQGSDAGFHTELSHWILLLGFLTTRLAIARSYVTEEFCTQRVRTRTWTRSGRPGNFGPEMPGWKRMVATKTLGKTHFRQSQ